MGRLGEGPEGFAHNAECVMDEGPTNAARSFGRAPRKLGGDLLETGAAGCL